MQIHPHKYTCIADTHTHDVMSWLYAQHLFWGGETRSTEPPSPCPETSILLHVAALTGTFMDILQMFAQEPPSTMSPCLPGICMFASTAGQWVIAKSTWLNTKGSGSRSVPHCPPLGRRHLPRGLLPSSRNKEDLYLTPLRKEGIGLILRRKSLHGREGNPPQNILVHTTFS